MLWEPFRSFRLRAIAVRPVEIEGARSRFLSWTKACVLQLLQLDITFIVATVWCEDHLAKPPGGGSDFFGFVLAVRPIESDF